MNSPRSDPVLGFRSGAVSLLWLISALSLALLVTLLPQAAAQAGPGTLAPINLTGGPVKVTLPTSGTTASIDFVNKTGVPIYDLLLSTQESSGFDPDFEGGPVNVSRGGTNLGWVTDPAPGDGVEDIKVMVPGIGTRTLPDPNKAIKNNQGFNLSFTSSDGFAAGDVLTVTPTKLRTIAAKHQGVVIPARTGGSHASAHSYSFFNGYANLPGRLMASWSGDSGAGAPIESIRLTSPNPAVQVLAAISDYPVVFDPFTGTMQFLPPIPPGTPFEYTFQLNATEPFDELDPNPYTQVDALVNAPSPLTLSVNGLVGGGIAQFDMQGALPGSPVALAMSLFGPGPLILPGGPCQGLSVDLSPPFDLLAVLFADPLGNAFFQIPVPPQAVGLPIWFQAVEPARCFKSNPVAEIIQ